MCCCRPIGLIILYAFELTTCVVPTAANGLNVITRYLDMCSICPSFGCTTWLQTMLQLLLINAREKCRHASTIASFIFFNRY